MTTAHRGSKILDFGIAKVVADGSRTVQQTAAIGTPVYMAPEQAMGDGHIGAPADLYALAHIAYALLAGDAYWMEEKQSLPMYPFLTKMLAGASEPPSARAARRGVALPAGFDAWFARATAREPRHRFDRASTQIAELAAALGTPAPRTLLGAPPPLGHRLPGPGSMPTPAEPSPRSSQPHVGSLPSGAVAAASQPISQPIGTNPSGMVAPPGASVGTMRAVLSPADPAPTAKRSAGSLVAGAILILAVGIGATVVVMRLGKQSPRAASAPAPATATALPAPTATAQAAAPSAKPTVSAAEATEEAGAPTASATVPPKPTVRPTLPQPPGPTPRPTAKPPAAAAAPFDPTRMR